MHIQLKQSGFLLRNIKDLWDLYNFTFKKIQKNRNQNNWCKQ